MDHLAIAALVGLFFIGVGLTIAGAFAPSLAEFYDRPLCWIRGHDLTRHLVNTTYEGRPAEVWACSRHEALVTVVKPDQGVRA